MRRLDREPRRSLSTSVIGGLVVVFLLLGLGHAALTGRANAQTTAAQPPDQPARAPATPAPTASAPAAEHGRAAHPGAGHADPFSEIMLGLAVVVVVAMVGRWLAGLCGQPAVLGELLIGVALGNIGFWLGRHFFVMIMHLGDAGPLFFEVWNSDLSVSEAAQHVFSSAELAAGGVGARLVEVFSGPDGARYVTLGFALWVFSSLGVILLLFMVGLESSIEGMLQVGARSLLVAVVGFVAPFALGYLTCLWLLPGSGTPTHLFLAAALCATSVGITARVFKDLGKLRTREARVILGAAVIDDVLGLIVLAVVIGIVATGRVDVREIGKISVLSLVFLGAVVFVGERLVRVVVRLVSILDRHHCKLLLPLALAFVMSWVANLIGLATIVGAFAAGLILNEQHFEKHPSKTTLEELMAPLERIFAPVFFVLMGMQVNLSTFAEPGTLGLVAAFTVVAIAGKIVCGLPAGKGLDRLTVGVGMVPRGEVGLIFASIGKGLGVLDDSVFSALVVVVMASTLVTPPALKWSLGRSWRADRPEYGGPRPHGAEAPPGSKPLLRRMGRSAQSTDSGGTGNLSA